VRAFVARLETIDGTGAYLTNAGRSIIVGAEPNLGESDVTEGIVLQVGADLIEWVQEHCRIQLPLLVQLVAKVESLEASMAAQDRLEALLHDVKVAVETADRRLGLGAKLNLSRWTTAPLERQPGSEYVGVVIEYRVGYSEKWGEP
jgi:hypothetical protein